MMLYKFRIIIIIIIIIVPITTFELPFRSPHVGIYRDSATPVTPSKKTK